MSKYLYAKHLYWLLVLAGVSRDLALFYVKHMVSQVSSWRWKEVAGLELLHAFNQARVYMKLWHTPTGLYRTRGKR